MDFFFFSICTPPLLSSLPSFLPFLLSIFSSLACWHISARWQIMWRWRVPGLIFQPNLSLCDSKKKPWSSPFYFPPHLIVITDQTLHKQTQLLVNSGPTRPSSSSSPSGRTACPRQRHHVFTLWISLRLKMLVGFWRELMSPAGSVGRRPTDHAWASVCLCVCPTDVVYHHHHYRV